MPHSRTDSKTPWIICIGDVMVDRFVDGSVQRISPEAPVPVLRKTHKLETLGGAGNVVRNLSSLEAHTHVICALDEGEGGSIARERMIELPHVTLQYCTPSKWSTPIKTRYFAHNQHLLRVDQEHTCTLSTRDADDLIQRASDSMAHASCVIVSDYAKGLLTPYMCQGIIQNARQNNVTVIVDPKGTDYTKYANAHIITPNLGELQAYIGRDLSSHDDILQAARSLLTHIHVDHVLVTLGAKGMMCVSKDCDEPLYCATKAQEVFDVSGAGDTVIATLAMALSMGHPIAHAMTLANTAAGIVVGRKGTSTIQKQDLDLSLDTDAPSFKIQTLHDARDTIEAWKKQGYTVGFTNGCFDLLHSGHLSLLRYAKSQCDKLIVGMNSDDSISRLKGSDRPIQKAGTRSDVLSSLDMVDLVIEFDQDTPLLLIETLTPHVLVKGADYTVDQVVGAPHVLQNGGRVALAPLKQGHSTTRTVSHIRKSA